MAQFFGLFLLEQKLISCLSESVSPEIESALISKNNEMDKVTFFWENQRKKEFRELRFKKSSRNDCVWINLNLFFQAMQMYFMLNEMYGNA